MILGLILQKGGGSLPLRPLPRPPLPLPLVNSDTDGEFAFPRLALLPPPATRLGLASWTEALLRPFARILGLARRAGLPPPGLSCPGLRVAVMLPGRSSLVFDAAGTRLPLEIFLKLCFLLKLLTL